MQIIGLQNSCCNTYPISVEDQSLQMPMLGEGLPQHVRRLAEIGPPRHVERHDLSVVHVEYRRQVQLARGYVELGDVRRPFLVARGGREVPFVGRSAPSLVGGLVNEQVLAGPVLVAFVGAVLPLRRYAVDPEPRHDPLDLLVVDPVSAVPQLEEDPPVAVSPFVLMVYLLDLLDDSFVFVVFINFVDRVEERRLFNPGNFEKDVKFI